jgi:glutamate synthase (NADPH/NADH) small chain
VEDLRREFHAILLAGGATRARDLKVVGRDLGGVHLAMQFLTQQNRRTAGDEIPDAEAIHAEGKSVVVLGGGDTGADCVGTAIRQGARFVKQLEIMPRPPDTRAADNPWPQWPRIFRTGSSQEEGCQREFSVTTNAFEGSAGKVERLKCSRVEWQRDDHGLWHMQEIAGSQFTIEADLVLLALGFLGQEDNPLIQHLGVELDSRGNVATNQSLATSVPGIYAAGDANRGPSLVAWAIDEGRRSAEAIDRYLQEEK